MMARAGLLGDQELAMLDRELAAREGVEGMRLGAERDVSNRLMNTAESVGQTRLGAEQGINAQGRQVSQYAADLGSNLEGAESTRAGNVAQNRQAVSQGNQQQQFQQGFNTSGALSERSADVAKTRLGEAAEAREYVTGQGAMNRSAAQNEYNRQAGIYGTEAGSAANFGQLQLENAKRPGFWSNLGKAAKGGLEAAAMFAAEGGVVTKPTMAVVGEAGPEAIVPLTKRENPRVQAGALPSYDRNSATPMRPSAPVPQPGGYDRNPLPRGSYDRTPSPRPTSGFKPIGASLRASAVPVNRTAMSPAPGPAPMAMSGPYPGPGPIVDPMYPPGMPRNFQDWQRRQPPAPGPVQPRPFIPRPTDGRIGLQPPVYGR
jgi:hypothetical protein